MRKEYKSFKAEALFGALVVTVLSGLGLNAQAETLVVDGLEYNVVGEREVEISGVAADFTPEASRLYLFDRVSADKVSYEVVGIAACAFSKEMEEVEEIRLPSAVRYLGEAAFSGMTGLKKIEFPASLKTIGKDCFKNSTQLSDIGTLEGSLEVATGAFSNTALRKLSYNTQSLKLEWDSWPIANPAVVEAFSSVPLLVDMGDWMIGSILIISDPLVEEYQSEKSLLIRDKTELQFEAPYADQEMLEATVGFSGFSDEEMGQWYPARRIYLPKNSSVEINLSGIVAAFGYMPTLEDYEVRVNGTLVDTPDNYRLSLAVANEDMVKVEISDPSKSGVAEISSDVEVKLYSLDGRFIGAGMADGLLRNVAEGVYILVSGDGAVRKIINR